MLNRYASLRQGLVGCWVPSLGASGYRLIDRSGNGNHGTLTNMDPGTDWVPSGGKLALDFDGSNDYVDLAASASKAASTFSYSVWMKSSSIGATQTIIGDVATNSSEYTRNFLFLFGSNFRLDQFPPSGGTGSNTTLSSNVWYHLVVTVVSGGTTNYYLNGTPDGSFASEANTDASTITAYRIGYRALTPWAFFGQLDDIRAYNRALTPSEIRLLYLGGRGVGLAPERIKHRRKTSAAATNRRRRIIIGASS